MKVNFLVCGAQKAGTTAFDSYLREHPNIGMPRRKELHFFDNEAHFAPGVPPDYALYHDEFSPRDTDLVWGEVTPIYMYWQPAARRIWEYNPAMKIIVLLRNPIERAYSHWNMMRERGEPLGFEEALEREPERLQSSLPLQNRDHSYADRGFYQEQLRRLWLYFGRDQVLVLRTGDLRSEPQRVLDRVFAFLGVPCLTVQSRNVFQKEYQRPLSEPQRGRLRRLYEFEIRGLAAELGWDLDDWLR